MFNKSNNKKYIPRAQTQNKSQYKFNFTTFIFCKWDISITRPYVFT